jgi:hypothetical protein
MPLLVRAKRKVARGIGSGAMAADAKQTEFIGNPVRWPTPECAMGFVVG